MSRFTKYVTLIDSAAAAGGICIGGGGGGGADPSSIDALNLEVDGTDPTSVSQAAAVTTLGTNISNRFFEVKSLKTLISGTASSGGDIKSVYLDTAMAISQSNAAAVSLYNVANGKSSSGNTIDLMQSLSGDMSSYVNLFQNSYVRIDGTTGSITNLLNASSKISASLTKAVSDYNLFGQLVDGSFFTHANLNSISSSLDSGIKNALLSQSLIRSVYLDGSSEGFDKSLLNVSATLGGFFKNTLSSISGGLNNIFDSAGALPDFRLDRIDEYLTTSSDDILGDFMSLRQYVSTGELQSLNDAVSHSGTFALVKDAPNSGSAPRTYVSNGKKWNPVVDGAGGGGVSGITANTALLDFGLQMTGTIVVTNPNDFSVGVNVTSSSANISIFEDNNSFIIPANSTYDLSVMRNNFSSFGGDLQLSASNEVDIVVGSGSGGTWTNAALAFGAEHIYDFKVGDALSDKAGSADITSDDPSSYSLSGQAIAGGEGRYTVVKTGNASGLRVAAADWHRDTNPRTIVWIGNIASITDNRVVFMGPGKNSGTTDSFFSLEYTSQWTMRGPTGNGDGWLDGGLVSDVKGDMMVIARWIPDSGGTYGYLKVVFVGKDGTTTRRFVTEVGNGTTGDDSFYFGGDGSYLPSQGASWDHFSVYDRALTDQEINHLLNLRGFAKVA